MVVAPTRNACTAAVFHSGGSCGASVARRSGALGCQPSSPFMSGVTSIDVAKNWCGTAVSSGR